MESFNSRLLRQASQFLKEVRGERLKGKSLPESGYKWRYVNIYRATPSLKDVHFHSMDYITLSRKFATGHADHNLAVNDEESPVITAMVKASDVYEAYNPGEYFYDGPEIKGRIIYIAKL